MSNIQDNEIYRRVHFAVMAIENGAKNLGISGLLALVVLMAQKGKLEVKVAT